MNEKADDREDTFVQREDTFVQESQARTAACLAQAMLHRTQAYESASKTLTPELLTYGNRFSIARDVACAFIRAGRTDRRAIAEDSLTIANDIAAGLGPHPELLYDVGDDDIDQPPPEL